MYTLRDLVHANTAKPHVLQLTIAQTKHRHRDDKYISEK